MVVITKRLWCSVLNCGWHSWWLTCCSGWTMTRRQCNTKLWPLCLPSKCPKWRMTPVMTVVMARMDDDRAKSRDRRRWLTAQLSWTVLRIVMMTLLIRSSTCGYQWYQHVSWFWLRNRCWFGSRHSCGLMPLSEFRHNRRSRIASPFTSGVTTECQRYQQGINPHSHRVSQVRAWQESDNFKSSWIIHFDLIR